MDNEGQSTSVPVHPLHSVSDSERSLRLVERLRIGVAEWNRIGALLEDAKLLTALEAAGTAIVDSLRGGGTLLVAGNGGSASMASHIAAEFVGKCILDRPPLPAVSLADSSTSITAVGNDYGFDEVFVRGVKSLGRPGDVLLVMSTSGNSPSILAALDAARERGLVTIALTGGTGGKLHGRADHVLVVPADETPRIQEVHLMWAHAWCEAVDVLSQNEDHGA